MRVLIATTVVPFLKGGGTKIVEDLEREMAARGVQVDTVRLPFYSAWMEVPEQTVAVRLLDLTESCGNRIDRVIAMRSPSYAVRHPNKVTWFMHHHREAFDLWGTKWTSIPDNEIGRHYRDLMLRADNTYLRECRRVFAQSGVVADRVRRFNNLDPDGVLYPPLPADHPYRPGPFGDYLLYAGRMTPLKRFDLAIEAMRYTDPAVRLMLLGAPDVPEYGASLRRLAVEAGVADRVEFTGWVTEQRKAELMAGCSGVLFLPFDEDYGYVTVEAFEAHKPVVTLTDSGASRELVEDGVNGVVCEPDPRALAEVMNRLWHDRAAAVRMGEEASRTLRRKGIYWDHVIETLLS
ncbi:MAG TPA: glycosyltransferase family 4 protein [Fimbriiglobus sp.]|nr:glycosyltransferase family 4 protein [Fimbriiglobus sp.]